MATPRSRALRKRRRRGERWCVLIGPTGGQPALSRLGLVRVRVLQEEDDEGSRDWMLVSALKGGIPFWSRREDLYLRREDAERRAAMIVLSEGAA